MKKLRNAATYILLFCFLALCLGNQIAGISLENGRNELYEKLDLFARVLTIIQNSYVEQVSSKDLIYGALQGTLASLDPYSEFLPPENFTELQIETDGEFGGLGMEVMVQDDILVIISAIPDTPAEHAGLKTDDQILRINGEDLKSLELSQAVKKLRGKPGSSVELTLFRPSTKKFFTVQLTREMIKIESVIRGQVIPETTMGYIKITQFQEGTASEFQEKKESLEASGMTGLILDLRNNPGGLLGEAIDMTSLLVGGDQLIVYTRGRVPEQNSEKISDKKTPSLPYPLVILINRGSASGSEIVAGAVQDHKTGVIVGEKSFGKASVQTLLPLDDGSALRLTTARYYTPKGRLIHGEGINPDVPVSLGKEDFLALKERREKISNGDLDRNSLYLDTQIKGAMNVIDGLRVYLKEEPDSEPESPPA